MGHTYGNVHVGDVGTRFKARLVDGDVNFDPSAADEMALIFLLPNGDMIERDAFVVTEGSGLKQKWYLCYDVETTDLVDGLFEEPGVYQWQGYLHFDDLTEYHTDIDSFVVSDNLD